MTPFEVPTVAAVKVDEVKTPPAETTCVKEIKEKVDEVSYKKSSQLKVNSYEANMANDESIIINDDDDDHSDIKVTSSLSSFKETVSSSSSKEVIIASTILDVSVNASQDTLTPKEPTQNLNAPLSAVDTVETNTVTTTDQVDLDSSVTSTRRRGRLSKAATSKAPVAEPEEECEANKSLNTRPKRGAPKEEAPTNDETKPKVGRRGRHSTLKVEEEQVKEAAKVDKPIEEEEKAVDAKVSKVEDIVATSKASEIVPEVEKETDKVEESKEASVAPPVSDEIAVGVKPKAGRRGRHPTLKVEEEQVKEAAAKIDKPIEEEEKAVDSKTEETETTSKVSVEAEKTEETKETDVVAAEKEPEQEAAEMSINVVPHEKSKPGRKKNAPKSTEEEDKSGVPAEETPASESRPRRSIRASLVPPPPPPVVAEAKPSKKRMSLSVTEQPKPAEEVVEEKKVEEKVEEEAVVVSKQVEATECDEKVDAKEEPKKTGECITRRSSLRVKSNLTSLNTIRETLRQKKTETILEKKVAVTAAAKATGEAAGAEGAAAGPKKRRKSNLNLSAVDKNESVSVPKKGKLASAVAFLDIYVNNIYRYSRVNFKNLKIIKEKSCSHTGKFRFIFCRAGSFDWMLVLS